MTTYSIKPTFFELCYVNGDPHGIIRIDIKDQSGYVGFRVPRPLLDLAKCRCGTDDILKVLRNRGIYFLIKCLPDGTVSKIYVGKAGERKDEKLGVLNRISEHGKKEESSNWDVAICLTHTSNVFNTTKLNYLEHKFHELLSSSLGKKAMYNGNTPTRSQPELSEKYNLDNFVKNQAALLVESMGFDFLSHETNVMLDSQFVFSASPTPVFKCTGAGADAQGCLTSGGFKILKGSKISDHVVACFAKNNKKAAHLRDALVNDGTIDSRIFTKDYQTGSPSFASGLILGRPSNGKDDWKLNGKQTLGEYLKLH